MLMELALMRNKAKLDATSQCLADERMANKDAMDRLRLELAEARATNDELQRALHRSGGEKGSLGSQQTGKPGWKPNPVFHTKNRSLLTYNYSL